VNGPRRLARRFRAGRVWRAWQRYSACRGSVLAGGISYFAILSLAPAVAVGFGVAGLVLNGHTGWQSDLVNYLNRSVGVHWVALHEGDPGLVSVPALVRASTVRLTAVLGLVLLVLTGFGWVGAVRQGLRQVFGVAGGGGPVRSRLRDLAVLVTAGLAVLVSATVSVGVAAGASWFMDRISLDSSTWTRAGVTGLTELLIVGVDLLILLFVFRVLGGVPLPVRALRSAALLGAVGLGVLQSAGGLLLTHTSHNGLLAASSVVVGVLVWTNLAGRVVLFSAAWAAVGAGPALPDALLPDAQWPGAPLPDTTLPGAPEALPVGEDGRARDFSAHRAAVRGDSAHRASRVHRASRGAGRRHPADVVPSGERPRAGGTPSFGPASADRVTLAAGAAIGAGALVAGTTLLRGLRNLFGLLRRSPRD